MLPNIINVYILFVFVVSGAESNLIEQLATFVEKIFAGFQLTSLYLLSLGTAYPPIDQDVTFWCVTRGGNETVQTFVGDPEIRTKIDFKFRTNFVIHGWLSGLLGGNLHLPSGGREANNWVRPAALRWSNVIDCNVCIVDWSRLANYDYSIAAMVNTKKVASYLIVFIDFLVQYGFVVEDAAIAGHSLGAQIASMVGRHYQGLLDAIYGLDPAGPGFTVPFDLGDRLTPADARYVQCIHSSKGSFGTQKDCGHADFILNGGYMQPGCAFWMCSHGRAHAVFIEALIAENVFIGVKCRGSIVNFISNFFGRICSSETDVLGIHAERKLGRFFVKTNSKSPFAQIINPIGSNLLGDMNAITT